MTIIIDSREEKSLSESLKVKGLDIEIDFIPVGDVLLDNSFAIEIKRKDLIQSIISNRLYEQLNALCDYEHPILCIVMDNIWKDFYYSNSRWIHSSYIGTLGTLTTSYPKLKTIFLNDEKQLVDYIVSLDKKIHKEGASERPKPIMRKAKLDSEIRENILCMIPGLAVGKSKKILECFGSIKNVANASAEEIQMVEGIGKKLSEVIRKYLNE